MANSGAYSFNPELGSLFLSAFGRDGVRPGELTPQHIWNARNEANFQQAEWANAGVLLWTQELRTFTMVPGQATYSVDPNTVMVLDLYISPNGSAGGQNRLILPFSRTDYASISNPDQTGFPTSFFFLRTTAPSLTFWPVPDDNATYECSYWCYRQIQDAEPRQGGNAEVQYLFLDAYVAGLAHRLSRYYAPQIEALRKADYADAFGLAMKQNTENVAMYISPGLAGYYR